MDEKENLRSKTLLQRNNAAAISFETPAGLFSVIGADAQEARDLIALMLEFEGVRELLGYKNKPKEESK